MSILYKQYQHITELPSLVQDDGLTPLGSVTPLPRATAFITDSAECHRAAASGIAS